MGPIENMLLIASGIVFWTAIVAIPVMIFGRISDLRRRVTFLEAELRRLAARPE